jgi:hypothetical protein
MWLASAHARLHLQLSQQSATAPISMLIPSAAAGACAPCCFKTLIEPWTGLCTRSCQRVTVPSQQDVADIRAVQRLRRAAGCMLVCKNRCLCVHLNLTWCMLRLALQRHDVCASPCCIAGLHRYCFAIVEPCICDISASGDAGAFVSGCFGLEVALCCLCLEQL